MGLSYQIPHTSHYLTKTNLFVATFNNPTAGQYDFGIASNTGQLISNLQKNKVYLIERVSIGGTVSESDYLDSISTLPQFRLKRRLNNENVYFQPYSVVNYIDDSEITAWILSEKGGDDLIIDFSGILNQIPSFIGRVTITIHITFSIFIVSSTIFYGKFRDKLSEQTGDQVGGAIDGDVLIREIRELINTLKFRR